jgi:hypothetical protein
MYSAALRQSEALAARGSAAVAAETDGGGGGGSGERGAGSGAVPAALREWEGDLGRRLQVRGCPFGWRSGGWGIAASVAAGGADAAQLLRLPPTSCTHGRQMSSCIGLDFRFEPAHWLAAALAGDQPTACRPASAGRLAPAPSTAVEIAVSAAPTGLTCRRRRALESCGGRSAVGLRHTWGPAAGHPLFREQAAAAAMAAAVAAALLWKGEGEGCSGVLATGVL